MSDNGDGNNGDGGGDSGKDFESLFNKADERAKRLEAENADFRKRFDGIDPEEISALRSTVKALESQLEANAGKGAGLDEEKVKELRGQIESKVRGELQKEVDGLKAKAEGATSKLQRYEIHREMQKLNIIDPQCMDLIDGALAAQCKVTDSGIQIIGPDGNQRFSADNPNQPLTLEDLAKEFVSTYPQIAVDKSANGTHSGQAQPTNGNFMSANKFAALSSRDQQQYLRDNPKAAKEILAQMGSRN